MFSLVMFPLLAATLAHAEDHRIVVGGPGLLAYTPSSIAAAVGDTITFEFHEKNHTATQSAFASPCSPLQGADGSYTGFDSDFMPVPPGTASNFPTYTITVNDTNPLWVYCKQPGPPAHCASGMVFAANAPEQGNTFDAFKAAAMALGGASASTTSALTATSSASASWTSPPPPDVATVTATVTLANSSVYTTTYASWAGASPNPTPAASPAVHTIIVGGSAGLVYTPPTVVAAVGDIVQFQFQAKNHSVTQSPFNAPCTNLAAATNGSTVGFDSGFMPVAANATAFPTFNFTVNTTTPIWGYCRQQGAPGQPTHCQAGMVFGINPPTSGTNTFAAFQQLAMHANATTTPTAGGNGTAGGNSTGAGTGGKQGNGAERAVVRAAWGVSVLGAVFLVFL